MDQNYHALIPGKIFMGGASDMQQVVDNEGVKVIVDLREEATQCAAEGEVEWVKIPLSDEASIQQAELLREAIHAITKAYGEDKKVAFHCGGGRGRTGTAAYGTLLELGLASSIDEAQNMGKAIRPQLNIKPAQREALEILYGEKNGVK